MIYRHPTTIMGNDRNRRGGDAALTLERAGGRKLNRRCARRERVTAHLSPGDSVDDLADLDLPAVAADATEVP